jgi:hypothetical protein
MTHRHIVGVLALGLVAAGLWGCSPSQPRAGERTPVRWIVVEKRANEVTEGGWVGDGRVDPQAVVLAMQPLYREDLEWEVVVDPHEYFVEVLEIAPGSHASPGETVTAKVRVGKARPGDRYRLIAKASRPDVQILGLPEQVVQGSTPAFFRFSSLSTGPGGIAVGVEKLEPGDRKLP